MSLSGDRATKYKWTQLQAIVASQYIRNELEAFHGGMGDGKFGFITDAQMKRLNICIRHAITHALQQQKILETAIRRSKHSKPLNAEEDAAIDFFDFQLATFSPDYMEAPETPELEKVYKEFVTDYEGE